MGSELVKPIIDRSKVRKNRMLGQDARNQNNACRHVWQVVE